VTVTLDKAEYRLLNQFRGLPEDAHMLVMCSRSGPDGGGVLDGDPEAFAELRSYVGEEIEQGRPTGRRALMSMYTKLDLACAEYDEE
jgi:hypothetical protein